MTKIFVATCMICVCFISMFDEIGIAGIIPLIQSHFNLGDSEAAIIKTSTSVTSTAMLIIMWIFGDSFKRRSLLLTSVAIWTTSSLLAAFLGSGSFIVFIIFRSISAAASAIFNVLVPVIMADLFQGRQLGLALMSITVAEMVSGIGAITFGSWIVSSGVPWQTGLIGAPILTIPPLLCLLCAKKNLPNVHRHEHGIAKILAGALSIISIKSYVLLTLAFSLASFNTTAYNFWFPSMYLIIWENAPEMFLGIPYTVISILNSVALLLGMAMGIPTLLWFAQSWREGTGLFSGRKEFLRAYPIVVSAGTALNAASFILSLLMLDRSYVACLIATFFVGIGTAADASLSQQMMMMVVPTSERAAAVALSRLIRAIVSIPAAQIIGMVADFIRGNSTIPSDSFRAYQLAMLCDCSLLIVTVICYVVLIFFFPDDCKKAGEIDAEEEEEEKDERTSLIRKTRLSIQ